MRRTICWNLAPEVPGYENHLSVMDLLFGKLALLDYEGAELSVRHPAADTFALVAGQLTDVDSVVRIEVPGRPGLYLFEVRRRARDPLLVVWDHRDSFSGEDDPPVPLRLALADLPGRRRRRLRPAPAGRGARRPPGAAGLRHPAVRDRRLTGPAAGAGYWRAWIFR